MEEPAVIISLNDTIKKLNNELFYLKPSLIAQAWSLCYQEFGKELADKADGSVLLTVGLPLSGKTSSALTDENIAKYDVIFDGNFSSKISRSAVINISIGAGWEVDCLHMTTPYNVCRNRNHRNANGQGTPFEVFKSLAKAHSEPKTLEGFREVLRINTKSVLRSYDDELEPA